MSPFDYILLTGILIVTMISVYILILKKLRPKSIRVNKITTDDSKVSAPKTRKKDMIVEKKTPETKQSKKSRPICLHSFGYLRTLPKNASLPDECLGCSQIIECLKHE